MPPHLYQFRYNLLFLTYSAERVTIISSVICSFEHFGSIPAGSHITTKLNVKPSRSVKHHLTRSQFFFPGRKNDSVKSISMTNRFRIFPLKRDGRPTKPSSSYKSFVTFKTSFPGRKWSHTKNSQCNWCNETENSV